MPTDNYDYDIKVRSPYETVAENDYIGNPFLQRGPWQNVAGTPIRTVLPPELRHTKTPEEEQAAYDEDIKRQTIEVELENRKLKQQTDRDKLTYDKNVLTQGQSFLTEIKNLNPGDPDYALHRASLIERMPLAVEHNSVKYQLSNLDKTDEGLRQNRAAVEEHKRATGVTQKQQDLTKARDWAAQKGARYLQQFQETLQNNPDADPVSVIAQIVDSQEEQKSIAELRRHEISDEEINKFRIQEVDANGQPTGRTIFNKEAADDYLKTFPTTTNINAAMSQRLKLREKLEEKYSTSDGKDIDWSQVPSDLQETWDNYNRVIERYHQKLGEGKVGKDVVSERPTGGTANLRFKSKPVQTTEDKPVEEIRKEEIEAAAEKLKKQQEASQRGIIYNR